LDLALTVLAKQTRQLIFRLIWSHQTRVS